MWEQEALYAELNKRAIVATSNYSAPGNFLHACHWSRCLVHEFSFTAIFNVINHGYRAATLKKNLLWLLLFYTAVGTYFYYEKVYRMMLPAIVS